MRLELAEYTLAGDEEAFLAKIYSGEGLDVIETIEARQGLRVCCPEEIAWSQGWIDDAQLQALAAPLAKNGYGQYLLSLISRGVVK